jgi:transposase InsO family protein
MVLGVKDVTFEKDKLCSACQAGKQVASHHPMKTYVSTTRPLELIHMDLFGLTTYKSLGGNLYCLVIVDDFSRYTWTFFLEDKDKTFDIFKKFATRAQNEFGSSMVKIRSDNGSEFATQKWKSIVMVKASSMNSPKNIHPNKMVWLRGRTKHSSLLPELC